LSTKAMNSRKSLYIRPPEPAAWLVAIGRSSLLLDI
jgi:hypothetical protein